VTKAKYLYDDDLNSLLGMSYKEALEFKIELGEILKRELLEVHFMKRDGNRVNDIISAQKFNQMLIDELHGKYEVK